MLNRVVSSALFFALCSPVSWGADFPGASGVERKLYVGSNSSEAVMKYTAEVEIRSTSAPSDDESRKAIDKQIEHLFGPMSFARFKAVPRGNEEITNIQVREVASGVYRAKYDYKGTIVLQNGAGDTYDVTLPINPVTIYKSGTVTRGGKKTYPCTDSHYQSEGDFWYFWNPKQYGCPLKQDKDYQVVKTSVSRFKNTTRTFPEYARLQEADGKIEIHMLMGMDSPDENSKDPTVSKDINASNWRDFRDSILRLGFEERRWKDSELYNIIPRGTLKPYVTEYTKKNESGLLVIRLFFGPSGIDENSKAFHYFMKDAIEKASVFMYDGHSGLGGHLDLDSIEETEDFKFAPNKNRYQIYFFNSCTSYTYYNTMYFERKKTQADPKGTKNLDILTNGLSTYFSVMVSSNLPIIQAIDGWMNHKGSVSYQELAHDIDSDNLFGVNGDEDNPTSP